MSRETKVQLRHLANLLDNFARYLYYTNKNSPQATNCVPFWAVLQG